MRSGGERAPATSQRSGSAAAGVTHDTGSSIISAEPRAAHSMRCKRGAWLRFSPAPVGDHQLEDHAMPEVVTPGWVKHAVFYQIFPDRFARSPVLPKPHN